MKKAHQIIASRLPSASFPSVINSHRLFAGTLITGALLLTGCQSTSLEQSNAITAKQTPAAAKTALATALQKQRRQSFSYHSNLEISNEQQFSDVDSTQLVASEYVDSYCDDSHDQAYGALLTKAQAQHKDIAATDYDDQREALKQSYLACSAAYEAWRDAHYDSESYAIDAAAEDVVDSVAEMETTASDMDSAREASATTVSPYVSPYYEKLFNEYENKQSKQDIKKSQLLDAYVLKPLSINAQGIYQPMAGKATMLVSAQYQARNHQSSINQPVYIDFKNGDIYLWADNFAMLNSELLDDKLGIKWRNKWLKLAIDDGTLPKGFGSELIKSHFAALDATFDAAPVSQFDYVAPNTLASLSPKLPAHQLPAMLASNQVIRRVQSAESYEQFYQDYMRIIYERLSQRYPELVKESAAYEAGDTNAKKFTSKALVQQMLAMIKNDIDSGSETVDETMAEAKEETKEGTILAKAETQQLYGFDKRGQLKWQHLRSELPSETASNKNMVIDVLQQYSAISAKNMAFPNLPNDVQVPNASNSIDVREYGNELMQYYRDGNGTAIGKMMFSVMPMAKEKFGAID
ncbi:hypothetical protein HQR03_06985 [Psychrobacter okhotskensis]|uniref:hypothetical protein n=1 Tax=Psychrobacter okhotskensis TaxID=212403 RepID=UPI001565B1B4|nr:hypothetical protein [Psychrobacter okhotskensis]NRD70279.1 hypothetical protein [Psychrobacter okhotskensis]